MEWTFTLTWHIKKIHCKSIIYFHLDLKSLNIFGWKISHFPWPQNNSVGTLLLLCCIFTTLNTNACLLHYELFFSFLFPPRTILWKILFTRDFLPHIHVLKSLQWSTKTRNTGFSETHRFPLWFMLLFQLSKYIVFHCLHL